MFSKILSSLFESDSQVDTPTTNQVVTKSKQSLPPTPTLPSVEEIHNAFNSDLDRILNEYNFRLESEQTFKSIIEKAQVMREVGFINAKTSIISKEEEDKITKAKDDFKALQYFQNKYPLYKFITRESIHILCKKYDLYFARAEKYIDDIPDKNLKEIQNFKISKLDASYNLAEYPCSEGVNLSPYSYTEDIINTEPNITERNRLLRELQERKESMSTSWSSILEYSTSSRKGVEKSFWIVAPLHMFSESITFTDDREESNFWSPDTNQMNPLILDPIVVKPVAYKDKEYFLIVSAWGQEASDELVVNHKMN